MIDGSFSKLLAATDTNKRQGDMRDDMYPTMRAKDAGLPPLHRTALEDVADFIRCRLHEGEYVPGDRLPPERVIAEQLGVGRPAVRQALVKLREEGYVITKRGGFGGNFVGDLVAAGRRWVQKMQADGGKELREIFDLRIAVEGRAGYLAALRRGEEDLAAMASAAARTSHLVVIWKQADPSTRAAYPVYGADLRFHQAVVAAAHNRYLSAAVAAARGKVFLAVLPRQYEDYVATIEDHTVVLSAIRSGDPNMASLAIMRHLDHIYSQLRELLELPGGNSLEVGGRP